MYPSETAAVDGTVGRACFAPLPSARRDVPDATLIARIATGDRLAMHAFFARHKTRVYRFLLRLVGDAASGDDLTSEVFLAVWRCADKFRGHAAASTWLLAIARFKALEELRRRRDTAPDPEELDANIPLPIRKHPGRTSIAARYCASAWARSRASTARSSISFITMRNRCKRSRRSSGFRAPP
jgi:RNA polymerase sigma factor (sigma-70 family)